MTPEVWRITSEHTTSSTLKSCAYTQYTAAKWTSVCTQSSGENETIFTEFLLQLFSTSICSLKMSSELIICLFIGKLLFFLFGLDSAGRHKLNWLRSVRGTFFYFSFLLKGTCCPWWLYCRIDKARSHRLQWVSGAFNTHPLLLRIHWKENWQSWGVIRFKPKWWQKCSALLLSGESLIALHAHWSWSFTLQQCAGRCVVGLEVRVSMD